MPGGSLYRWGRGFPRFSGVDREGTRWPSAGSAGSGQDLRAKIFLIQFALEINEDFRRRPVVWNGSAEEGASRGAGPGWAAVAGNWISGSGSGRGGGGASGGELGPGQGPALGGAGWAGPSRVPETEGTSERRGQGRPAHL